MISPTRVASPIAVAEKLWRYSFRDTSTMISAAMACPALHRNKMVASNHGKRYSPLTCRDNGTIADNTARINSTGFRPSRSEMAGNTNRKNLPAHWPQQKADSRRCFVHDLRDIERGKNIQEKQPAHEPRRSDTAQPHVSKPEDQDVFGETGNAVMASAYLSCLRLPHKFPKQSAHHQPGNPRYEKGPTPSEAGGHLGGEDGRCRKSNQGRRADHNADISSASARRDVSSIIAVMIDQHGPSAKPNSARTSRSSPKLWTIPEIQDSAENRKIAGTSTGRRPNRSDSAPKKKADTAHAIATTEARIPICSLPRKLRREKRRQIHLGHAIEKDGAPG